MIAGVLALTLLAGILAALLGWLNGCRPTGTGEAVEQVLRHLPQTQCAQCGYPGCRPYAEAMVANRAPIDLCPPGGETTVRGLAQLLGREPVLPPTPGAAPSMGTAIIDEAVCIGCARCLPACPVDAIVGAHGYLHTVMSAECTGCALCVPACPVDCIRMSGPAQAGQEYPR